jgi:hypothetical protein
MSATFSPDDVTSRTPGKPVARESRRTDGYRGIWYALGFQFEYGDKYSGGLGTYTANHQPMAVFSPVANKTFFTYGGTQHRDSRELAIMVSYYDHATGKLPRPVILYLDASVDDPHDNAAIHLDAAGHVWVFKSGRGVKRPGLIFRSVEPYSIDAFEFVSAQEFTYPQVWAGPEQGMLLLFAKYTFYDDRSPARNLFWKTSRDGRTWSGDGKLAGFDGHYQTSGQWRNKTATFFNWHPGGDNDKRTNVYYAQTVDGGKTWTTAGGIPLDLPLESRDNGALIADLEAEGKCMYTCDLAFDGEGNPVLLFISSRKGEPGPAGDPREWTVMHWKDGCWLAHVVTTSDHNYDMGSLYISGNEWKIIGPALPGPQRYGTGGEMGLFVSWDEGKTWNCGKVITSGSPYNHSYARRPLHAADPFYAFWADGDPGRMSESHLYFTDSSGARVWQLPYEMKDASGSPVEMGKR